MSRKVLVVGGGAAGLMAAGQAASQGAQCIILEKMTSPGRKLRITGKGRCNLTNTAELREFIASFGRNGRFLRQAFNLLSPADLLAFFEMIGVRTVTERGGRVFPESDEARDVVESLIRWSSRAGAKTKTSSQVKKLNVSEKGISGVLLTDGSTVDADAVIVTTGGSSYPGTGSTGDGFRLARSVGHKIIPVRPALVPIETEGDTAARLEGLSLQNVSVRVLVDGKRKADAFGEMIFTGFGLSGPIILTLSRLVVDELIADHKVTLTIDLKPALDDGKLDARLRRDFEANARKAFSNILTGLLPRKLIPVCIEQVGIDPEKNGNQIIAEERKRLRLWLKDFRFKVTGYRPIAEAIITAGGVDTREINPRTMESNLVKGLYFAGEVLDIDADTGGYNLQAAFSTGWVAGRSAAETSK